MKKIILLLSISCLLSINSCKNHRGTTTEIEIQTQKQTRVNISDIANEIKYISLASDSIISTIMKIVISKNEIFIKDNQSKFLRFSSNGKFLNKIGNVGKGHGEYEFINDFMVDENSGEIFTLVSNPPKLYVYTKDDKLIKENNLENYYPMQIGLAENNIVYYCKNPFESTPFNLIITDYNGRVLEKFNDKYLFKRSNTLIEFSNDCIFYYFNNSLHFKELMSDTVFEFDNLNLRPKYVFNSNGKTISITDRSQLKFFENNIQNYIVPTNIIESKYYVFYSYVYSKKRHMLIYNKVNNEKFEIDLSFGFFNDLDGGPNLQFKTAKDDNTLLSWINAYELKTHVASEAFQKSIPKYPEKKKELERLANSLSENDNPVLMLVKLKE